MFFNIFLPSLGYILSAHILNGDKILLYGIKPSKRGILDV